jgi:hypothetical protein
MDQASITQYIADTFDGVDIVVGSGDTFFIYDPERNFPPNRRLPFATIVTKDDEYDRSSNLDRPAVFRLNIGVSKETYRSLFGSYTPPSDASSVADGDYDFAALDRLLPHPVYGRMFWICVLNPSAATFETLRPLLAEAYALSIRRRTKRQPVD